MGRGSGLSVYPFISREMDNWVLVHLRSGEARPRSGSSRYSSRRIRLADHR